MLLLITISTNITSIARELNLLELNSKLDTFLITVIVVVVNLTCNSQAIVILLLDKISSTS